FATGAFLRCLVLSEFSSELDRHVFCQHREAMLRRVVERRVLKNSVSNRKDRVGGDRDERFPATSPLGRRVAEQHFVDLACSLISVSADERMAAALEVLVVAECRNVQPWAGSKAEVTKHESQERLASVVQQY